MPQDGQEKQDGEPRAGTRWRRQHAEVFAPPQVTFLGDDLYSKQPLCALALAQGFNGILVCQPAAHAKLYERIALWPANDGSATCASRHWNGRCTAVSMERSLHDVLRLDGKEALSVHGCEITVVNAKTGAQLSHKSLITNHRGTAENVAAVAPAGRGRWKIENANNHGLTTKGYHVEHHLGHGQQDLSAVMCSRNLLAFLFHTVLEWSDDKYAFLRRVLARRQTFFDDIRALTRSRVFDSWDHFIDFMLQGLELQSLLDTG